jgi:hypothetical protein
MIESHTGKEGEKSTEEKSIVVSKGTILESSNPITRSQELQKRRKIEKAKTRKNIELIIV